MKKQIVWTGILFLLSGCTSPVDEFATDEDHLAISITPDVTETGDDTEIAIAEAARSATASLQKLAQMQFAAQPQAEETFRQDFSVELSGLASVEYTGPCEPLIRQIAKTANVRVSQIGSPTATAIIVSISAKSAPLSEIIQNIAYQVQSHARISFNPETKVIEIIYHNA